MFYFLTVIALTAVWAKGGWFYVSVCVIAGQYDPVSAHINKKLLKPSIGHFISVMGQKAHTLTVQINIQVCYHSPSFLFFFNGYANPFN